MTTIFLGKLIGLYLVAISLGMLINGRRAADTLNEMARNRPWMMFSGMVATAVGLALVLGHPEWHGGVLPVLVTLTGWAALIKGLALLLASPERMAEAYDGLRFQRYFSIWMGLVLILGIVMAALAFSS